MKKGKLRKKAKWRPLLARLKGKAWALMSWYVRLRDKHCFTCNAKADQAGHWKHGVCDYEEWNIHGQCTRCNFFLSGNLATYTLRMIDKYGLKKVKEYEKIAAKSQGRKYKVAEIKDVIAELQKKIKELYLK